MSVEKVRKFLKGNGGWVVLALAVLAFFLPDPTDLLDAGTPLLESAVAIITILAKVSK